MRMARGYGQWVEARQRAEYLLTDIERGDMELGDRVWLPTYVPATLDYRFTSVAYDGELVVMARGLTRGEQIASGMQSEWQVTTRQ